MSWGAIGAFLAVLVAVFAVGRLWFHLVESILERLKRLLGRREDPPVWHSLPREEKNDRSGRSSGAD